MRGTLLVATTLLMMMLAGCVGGDDESEEQAPEVPEDAILITDDSGDQRLVAPRPARYAEAERYVHTETAAGTFEAGQHWTNHGEVLAHSGQDAGSLHVRDITDMVPVGVPLRFELEMNADLQHGDLDVWVSVPNEAIWTFNANAPFGGYTYLEFGMMRLEDEPVTLNVFYDEAEPVQSFDYEVTYTIDSDPNQLYPGIPAIVPVPAGATTIEFAFNGTDPGTVVLYDPDDTPLARLEGSDGAARYELGAGAPIGDYVALVPNDSPPATVHVVAPVEDQVSPLDLGVLAQDIQRGDSVAFGVNEDGSVTFETPRPPVQVGIGVLIETLTDGADLELVGPEGELLSAAFTASPPFLLPFPDDRIGFNFLTRIGVPGLVAGEYIGTFSADTHDAGEIFPWIVHYQR